MENLEELKKLVATIKKKDKKLSKFSELKIITALRISSLVDKRLGNKLDIPNNILYLRFLISIIGKKKTFSINDIRMDLLNNVDIEEIAISYCEPAEVILEIKKRNLMFENEIVASKIYSPKELGIVLNKHKTMDTVIPPFLQKISDKSEGEKMYWWSGEKILKNYINILNTSIITEYDIVINNKKYLTLNSAALIMGLTKENIEIRCRKKQDFFGVNVHIKKIKKPNGSRYRNYLLESSVIDAKNNKKYYIVHNKVFNYRVISGDHHRILKEMYVSKYSKEIDFLSHYIKKENLDNYINLAVELGYDKELLLKK